MTALLHRFLNTRGFMSHGHCYLWNRSLVILHVSSDLSIGIAYVVISLTLWHFVRLARKEIPFHWMFISFGAFIIACGATHLMEVWTIWTPLYWVSGAIKVVTAVASVITAVALPPIIPKSLKMVKDAHLSQVRKKDLEASNAALRIEIAERKHAEEEIRHLNRELESLVEVRTSELAKADSSLSATLQQLQRSEERLVQVGEDSFHLIANSIPQLAWIADRDGWIYWYNQRWYDYTGTTAQEMAGWGWQSVHDSKYLPIVLENWQTSISTGQPFDMEFPLRGRDGNYRMFMTRVMPVRDSTHQIVRWVGTNTDVQDHRRTEERLRRLYDSGMMGVFYWEPGGAISEANDKFLEIVGYVRQDLWNGEMSWSRMTPSEYADQDQNLLVELRQGQVIRSIEKEFIRKNGTRVQIELGAAATSAPLSEGVAFVLDITQRKQAEASVADLNQSLEERVQARTVELAQANQKLAESQANLKAVLDGATEVAIIAVDPTGIISVFNSGAEKMLQYRADEVVGIHSPSIFHVESECIARSNVLTEELGRPVEGFDVFVEPVRVKGFDAREWCYLRKDGTTMTVSVSITAVRDANGAISGFVGISSDITAQKALEAELRDRNLKLEKGVQERTERLQAALAEKTVLLKEVHHRVKNNLAIVASLLAMQADAMQDEKAIKPLLESQRRVHSMALIHEHLYGTKNLSRVRFDEYAETLANDLYVAYSSPTRILVRMRVEPIELAIDKAIPCGLILNELLSNAFKYAFPHGRPGQITVSFAAQNASSYLLEVSDDGVGFSESLETSQSGTLGLKIVQILSNQLAGTLAMRSDAGTHFELRFPIDDHEPA